MTSARHEFQVDRAVLKSLITAQSGTVEKALLELVMNALDAGATRVDIALKPKSFSVEDNGKGFANEDEFHAFCGVFGFDHDVHSRQVGRFGIGRGQVLAMAKTNWRTSTLEADVDVVEHGYGYALKKHPTPVCGVTVKGTFYTPIDGVALYHAKRELERLCKYALVDIFVNGKQINADPDKEQWDFQDEHAYYRIRDTNQIQVYSQGFAVQDIYSYQYGAGGTVVTKRGHALAMNMARNDILKNTCPIWKDIDPVIRKLCRQLTAKAATRNTTTDAMRATRVAELMAAARGDWKAQGALTDEKLMTLTDGKHVSLQTILARKVWTVGEDRSTSAERLHRGGITAVLSPRTLERFSVGSVAQLRSALQDVIAKSGSVGRLLAAIATSEDPRTCPGFDEGDYRNVLVKDITPRAKQALTVLRDINGRLARRLGKTERTIVPGESTDAEAWTDGKHYIAIDKQVLHRTISGGIAGFHRATVLLVHEYLHDAASNISHGHAPEFYADFHEAMFEPDVQDVALAAYARYCQKAKDVPKARLTALASWIEVDAEIADGTLKEPVDIDVMTGHEGEPRIDKVSAI